SRFCGSVLYAAKESKSMVLANLLVSTGLRVLVFASYNRGMDHHTKFVRSTSTSAKFCDVEVLWSWNGLWNRRHSLWTDHSLFRFFLNLCHIHWNLLCSRHIVTATC